jgi:hypothetical protein
VPPDKLQEIKISLPAGESVGVRPSLREKLTPFICYCRSRGYLPAIRAGSAISVKDEETATYRNSVAEVVSTPYSDGNETSSPGSF